MNFQKYVYKNFPNECCREGLGKHHAERLPLLAGVLRHLELLLCLDEQKLLLHVALWSLHLLTHLLAKEMLKEKFTS